MTHRVVAVALMTCAAGVSSISLDAQQEQKPSGSVFAPVDGTTDGGGTFAGTLLIRRFEAKNNGLVAIGTVSGVLTAGADADRNLITQVALPVDVGPGGGGQGSRGIAAPNSCEALHLELETPALNVLGTNLAIDPVALDFATAQPGRAPAPAPGTPTTPSPNPGTPEPSDPADPDDPPPAGPAPADPQTRSGLVIVGGSPGSGGQGTASAPAGTRTPGVSTPLRTSAAEPQPELGEILCSISKLGEPGGSRMAQLLNQLLAVLG